MDMDIRYILLALALLALVDAILLVAVLLRRKDGNREADLSGIEARLDEMSRSYSSQMGLFFQESRASSGRIEKAQKESLQEIANVLDAIRDDNFRTMDSVIKGTQGLADEVRRGMDRIREENSAQLERMRTTVDEKLHYLEQCGLRVKMGITNAGGDKDLYIMLLKSFRDNREMKQTKISMLLDNIADGDDMWEFLASQISDARIEANELGNNELADLLTQIEVYIRAEDLDSINSRMTLVNNLWDGLASVLQVL